MPLALSFVIPLYNSAATIASLVHDIEALTIEGGHEVDPRQRRQRRCDDQGLPGPRAVPPGFPITLVEHARNFGEHNAVLTGWRHARGAYIVNLDDDGQNPPAEAVRLWQHARREGLDVVFGHYEVKRHSTLAQRRQLVHEPHDRLGARQAAGLLPLELSLRQRVRDRPGRRLRWPVSIHRRAVAAGDPADRVDHRASRRAARRRERLHASAADSALAERVAELLAAAAAGGDRRRRRDARLPGSWRLSLSSGCGSSIAVPPMDGAG